MHCDVDQPGSIDNLRTVLDTIGMDRIDHGTNIVEDPALVARVREQGIGLTCCPVSNFWVTQDMKAEEIVALLRAGVLVYQLRRPRLLRGLHRGELPGVGR